MKQVLIRKGKVLVEKVPAPEVSDKGILVKVYYSCISAGTEMSGVKESGKSLIKKAVEQPDKVKKALIIAKDQGVKKLLGKVKGLDTPRATGYSAAGIVIAVGKDITDIKVGDKVACAGAGYANHAEYIEVPRNLVMKVPEGLDVKLASTVTLGGIAMQGVRRADIRLGEYVAVLGMGILGQITAQLLVASGCRVIGVDIDERRLSIAKELGCDFVINSMQANVVREIQKITNDRGVDVAIITAATNSNELLSQAFKSCKKKGKVVLVGVVGNEFNRDDMYQKELDLIISTSYGPGRYDEVYEEKGIDYPYAYVRWTENRNMEEYLRLLNEKKVNLEKLIEGEYNIEDAPQAYNAFENSGIKPLIFLLKYNNEDSESPNRLIKLKDKIINNKKINVAIIGAGEFAKNFHLPNLQKLSHLYNIHAIMTRTGLNAKAIAEQYDAAYATTDYNEILTNPEVDMVIISTRHNLHASMAIKALRSGKAVFLEKPLALNNDELEEIMEVAEKVGIPFMVGYNRRFSKYAKEIKSQISSRKTPLVVNYQMNAGYIPLDHWVHTNEGGGRIIGEACHIIDLFNFFTDSKIVSISVNSINSKVENFTFTDNLITTIAYSDGSVCSLTYTSLGDSSFPKETCNIYFDNKVLVLNDYKNLTGFGVNVELNSKISDKGQEEALLTFYEAIVKKSNPIPLWDLEQTSKATFLINEELKSH